MDTDRILYWLGVEHRAADLDFLNALIAAYARRVPWETASRLVRRATISRDQDCPRLPEHFWNEAIQLGTGGTCFESNGAFFDLLRSLGFDGYLTINDMGQTIGCHTAAVIRLGDQSYIADAGFPVHAALPFAAGQVTETHTPLMTYRVHSLGDSRYDVERSPHPKPNAYTLVDTPVSPLDYEAATIRDYGQNGLFLDQLIINKVINEQQWRFATSANPTHLEIFSDGVSHEIPITGDAVNTLHATFGVDAALLTAAFHALGE
jgi:arylamine N-acetyltransferase